MYQKAKQTVSKLIPRKVLFKYEPVFRSFLYQFYRGNQYSCNICGAKLNHFIVLPNDDLLCPKCGSISRNRRLWELLDNEFLTDKAQILDFSPSRSLYRKLKNLKSVVYTGTDLSNDFLADKRFDITAINTGDSSFDLIICYHILEHVADDRLAMRELYRVLKPQGVCLIQTPFKEGETYEDDSITSESGRLEHFGQEDHVRIYSVEDLKNRLEESGFRVDVRKFQTAGDNKQGLNPNETVLVGTKTGY